jgi:hypothetical protein
LFLRCAFACGLALAATLAPGSLRAAEPAARPASLLGAPSELVYTPVAPSRLIDTRRAGGSLAPGSPRDFKVSGSGLQIQGGAPEGCGVPVSAAKAAVVNFTAVNPTGSGNLRAWAYSEPPEPAPVASIVNYAFVPGLNIANAIVIPLCDDDHTTCSGLDIRVQADNSGTHLVADVVGFFEFPSDGAGGPPPGTVLDYVGSTAPAGYLLCDGSAVSRAAYRRLFAVIGTAFGDGDDAATFRLPDFRSETRSAKPYLNKIIRY